MEIVGMILAVMLGSSFLALAIFFVAGAAVSVATVRSAHRQRRTTAELNRVLDDIVGPRSPVATGISHSPPSWRQ